MFINETKMQSMGKESFLLEFSKTMETVWPYMVIDGAQALAFKSSESRASNNGAVIIQ